jgi:hypothetical protein
VLVLATVLLGPLTLGALPPIFEQETYRATAANYILVPSYKPVPG